MDDPFVRIWHHLLGRVSGPLHLRLLIQPVIALLFGIRDGLRDAREGKPAYFWTIFVEPSQRRLLLSHGWQSIAKVFLIAVGIDVIYQLIELNFVYPAEALLVGFLLAVLPYMVIRGPVNRIARYWFRKRP